MIIDSVLLENLCRSLAFHAIETELTAAHIDGDGDPAAGFHESVDTAVSLIHEAGFDFNALYPREDRPIAIDVESGRVTRV